MSARKIRAQSPEICPVCGEEVLPRSLACPGCGADHNSGWREGAESRDALGEEEEDFDYDKFVAEEFGSSAKPAGIKTVWWITAILILIALAALFFYRLG
ncbi:MAG: hypothetical protein H0U88_08295 [Chthoniobacterales bacterium]|nr:hypothetical protein [Chthoniobacterales bacterium]